MAVLHRIACVAVAADLARSRQRQAPPLLAARTLVVGTPGRGQLMCDKTGHLQKRSALLWFLQP